MNFPGCPGSQLFTSNGIFKVLKGLKSLRALLVGGGASGWCVDGGGGGSGYVACGNFTVNNETSVSVTVGAGGLPNLSTLLPNQGTI